MASRIGHSFKFLFCLLLAPLAFSISIPRISFRDSSPPTVHAEPTGKFIGSTNDFYGVDSWLGIPYAKPPTGSLRLQPPQPIGGVGTFEATAFGAQCYQLPPPADTTISEDCLTLNIYKPSSEALGPLDGDGLPVMFWIHGGGFNDGSGAVYDGSSLVNRSIELKTPTIVVTINYRLSFFGFPGM
jgi:carboxylesterase type B